MAAMGEMQVRECIELGDRLDAENGGEWWQGKSVGWLSVSDCEPGGGQHQFLGQRMKQEEKILQVGGWKKSFLLKMTILRCLWDNPKRQSSQEAQHVWIEAQDGFNECAGYQNICV